MSEVKLWPFERLKPKSWNGEAVTFREEKKDGHRYTFFNVRGSQVQAFARKDEDVFPKLVLHRANWPWVTQLLQTLPPGSCLDGELHLPRPKWKASDVPTAIKEGWPELTFTPFAVPYWEGMRWYLRDCAMIQEHLVRHGWVPPYQRAFSSGESWKDERQRMKTVARVSDIEGYVLKLHNYAGWYKVKVEKTVDLVVMGIKPGTGKYRRMAGALKCGAWEANELVEVTSCSGMGDDVRESITDNDVGRVCEVEYQELTSGGRLRHPRFIRWRDDKPATECTIHQLREG